MIKDVSSAMNMHRYGEGGGVNPGPAVVVCVGRSRLWERRAELRNMGASVRDLSRGGSMVSSTGF